MFAPIPKLPAATTPVLSTGDLVHGASPSVIALFLAGTVLAGLVLSESHTPAERAGTEPGLTGSRGATEGVCAMAVVAVPVLAHQRLQLPSQ